MGTFVLKRKLYAEEQEQKKGMGLGKKLAIGATAVGGAFLGAKRGAFGNVGRMAAGRAQMNVGNLFNSKSMYKGGAKTYAKGYVGDMNKLNNNTMTKMQQGRAGVTVVQNQMKNFKGNAPKVTAPVTGTPNVPAKIN